MQTPHRQTTATGPTTNFFLKLGQQGFSLIEILIALVLVGLIYSIVKSDSLTSNRQLMEEAINDIERAIRYSVDEAALRNTIVRVWFDLEQNPVEYAVEYGPNDHTVIPFSKDADESNILTAESNAKKLSQFDKKFNRVSEFQEKNKNFPEGIRMVGIGQGQTKKFISTGKVAIYIYPSGEKDEAFLALANDEEMITLEIDSYGEDFHRKYYSFENPGDINQMFEERKKQAKETFDKWLK